jgi:hypothetical protein
MLMGIGSPGTIQAVSDARWHAPECLMIMNSSFQRLMWL